MDRGWIKEQLVDFRYHADTWITSQHSTNTYADAEQALSAMRQLEATADRIRLLLAPNLPPVDSDDPLEARDTVLRCLGILRDRDEWKIRLAPDAPALFADKLHPWVWDAASTFWESNHFQAAVASAASSINARLQDKIERRDVSDSKAVQEAFSANDPEAGRPRLRVAGDPTDETVQSRQRGALQLGLACVAAIRNPAVHTNSEFSEQEALEQLATLSMFARVVDLSEVVKAENAA